MNTCQYIFIQCRKENLKELLIKYRIFPAACISPYNNPTGTSFQHAKRFIFYNTFYPIHQPVDDSFSENIELFQLEITLKGNSNFFYNRCPHSHTKATWIDNNDTNKFFHLKQTKLQSSSLLYQHGADIYLDRNYISQHYEMKYKLLNI